MIVVIAGMQRSGSTFSFNIARHLLVRRGTIYQEAADDAVGVVQRAGEANHVLIKSHCLDDAGVSLIRQGAVKAVCTVRKPEDAVASWMRTFGFPRDQAITAIGDWLGLYRRIEPYVLSINYEEVEHRPLLAAWRIARYICRAPPHEVVAAWRSNRKRALKAKYDEFAREDENAVDIGFSYYDAESFLHRRHISSLEPQCAVDLLSADDVAHIRASLTEVTGLDRKGVRATPHEGIQSTGSSH